MKIDRHPRPTFSVEDANRAADTVFGIKGEVLELAGERDRNFLITNQKNEKYVLKVCNPADSDDVIDFQNQLLSHLSSINNQWQWPLPLPDQNGSLIGYTHNSDNEKIRIRLLTFVDGIFLADYYPHSSYLMGQLGRFLGKVTRSFSDFTHPAMERKLFWDMKNGIGLIREHVDEINDSKREDIVHHFLSIIENALLPVQDDLRTGVIYNDANDHNILVKSDANGKGAIVGAIDVGDSVHSWLVAEPAVACAYAMLNKPDPLATAREITCSYHNTFPLTEEEISVLFALSCLRSCMTVTIAAHQKSLEPENAYLSVSEASAWQLLGMLKIISPEFAHFSFRHACGLEPSPSTTHLVQWINEHKGQFSKVVNLDLNTSQVRTVDLSVGSLDLTNGVWKNMEALTEIIGTPALGRYDEPRMIYTFDQFRTVGNNSDEWRTIHLGIDIFLRAGSSIFSPLVGVVHSVKDNEGNLDYGPTVILKHSPEEKVHFFTLYGHLSRDVIKSLKKGDTVLAGSQIGQIGNESENGGWSPHLHFQVMTNCLNYSGDFPGVTKPSERNIWLSISPDPSPLLAIENDKAVAREESPEEISDSRHCHLGPMLSLSYQTPLKIVRGWLQYLFDHEGRKYLDGVNNVPHVGHSHPKVVEAIQKQTAVLNTNTRYLHENITRLAERITDTMPETLSVCFFVNSGSEANDLALRMAHAHTGGENVITVEGGYHGHLISLIDVSPYKFDGLGGKGLADHVEMVPMPDGYRGEYKYKEPNLGERYADKVEDAVNKIKNKSEKLSAFISESMISSGGLVIPPENYLATAYEHVRKAGGVCIADEVVVGFGRVGSHFWGFETQAVVPDIVTLGKPMGNGHPIAAVVTTPEIATSFNTGMEYFNTYGGNPVSCSAALAVLDVLHEEKLQENAAVVGKFLIARLKSFQEEFPIIGDVRGSGFFIGVELVKNRDSLEPAPEHASYVTERMKEQGILISTDGIRHNVLKIRPPMVFTQRNAELLVSTMNDVLQDSFFQ